MAGESTSETGAASPETSLLGAWDADYCLALGRFVDAFSRVEGLLIMLFRRLAGVDGDTAAAVFSGVRVKEAMGFIKRLSEVKPCPGLDRAELDDVFSHLALVTQFRNDVLHYGAQRGDDGQFIVSNSRAALTPAKVREMQASPGVLYLLCEDLEKALVHIVFFRMVVAGQTADHLPDVMAAARRRAWRYKPDAQARTDQPRPPTLQEPPPPR